jgi:hypothetical protein
MLRADAIAAVTTYARGKKPLPAPNDIKRLTSLTKRVYVTSDKTAPSTKWPPAVEATLGETTVQIADAEPQPGHIRLRRDISGGAWNVELFADALRAA